MTEFLSDYGLVVLFGIGLLQTAGIPGLPGKTALVAASILAARGHFAIWHVIAVTAVGVALGGYAGYAIGRFGGRRVFRRPFVEQRLGGLLKKTERFFESHGPKAVFLARFFPGVKVAAAPVAGLCAMGFAPFSVWHTLGAIAFALGFGLAAYYAGEGIIELAEAFGVYALVPLAALATLAWLGYRWYRHDESPRALLDGLRERRRAARARAS